MQIKVLFIFCKPYDELVGSKHVALFKKKDFFFNN